MAVLTNMTSLNDASQKFFCHKVPNTTVKLADLAQELANAVAFPSSTPIVSRFMGNPTSLNLFLSTDTAATITVSLSPNGDHWYQLETIVLAANAASITNIVGAGFIQLSTNTNITTFSSHVVANS